MKRIALAAVIATVFSTAVQAQGVCTTVGGPCASEPNQVLAYARQLLELNQQITIALQEVTNTLSLGATAFNDLTAEVNAIAAIAADANMLAGHSGEILTRLTTYTDPSALNWHQISADNSAAVGKAMTDAATIINQLQTLGRDTATLAALVSQIMAVVGRQQSLQTLQASLSQTGQSLQRTQLTTVANQQAELTYLAAQQDWKRIVQSITDRDLEIVWVQECHDVVSLGGAVSPACAGSQ